MYRPTLLWALLAGAGCETTDPADCDAFIASCEDMLLIDLADPEAPEGQYLIKVTPEDEAPLTCSIRYEPQGRDVGDCEDFGARFISGGLSFPVDGTPATVTVQVSHAGVSVVDEVLVPEYGPAVDGACQADDCSQAIESVQIP